MGLCRTGSRVVSRVGYRAFSEPVGRMTQTEYSPEQLMEADNELILGLYGRGPFIFTHGKGSTLYTHDNKKFLDCFSGVAVTSLGHSHPAFVEAVQDQVTKLTHLSNYYHNEWGVPIAKRLVDSCNFADKVFFCNTGAEACEGAFKMSRKVSKAIHADKVDVVAFKGSFHGRTMGAVSMTSKDIYRKPFAPLVSNIQFSKVNDIDDIKKHVTDRTSAVIIEPIQGEGGNNPASVEFLRTLRELCDKHQASLIFDEVQCGLARTGYLWAHQAYPLKDGSDEVVEPDIMTFAKPIAGGIPMGGLLLSKHVASHIVKGDHGTTFGGGPLACRAATVVFDELSKPEMLKHVRESGEYLMNSIREIKSDKIVDVRGRGMLIGVELSTSVTPYLKYVQEKGFLMISAGDNVIRLAPPLVMTRDEQSSVVQVLADALKEVK